MTGDIALVDDQLEFPDIWTFAWRRAERERHCSRVPFGRRMLPGRRGAYGRRRGSHALLEQARQATPEEMLAAGVIVEEQRLRSGGIVRWWRCQQCGMRRRALYQSVICIRCRECADLRYSSEYAGRRMEARANRWEAALTQTLAAGPRRRTTHERRFARALTAMALDEARQTVWRKRYAAAWDVILAEEAIRCLRVHLRLLRFQVTEASQGDNTEACATLQRRMEGLRDEMEQARRKRDGAQAELDHLNARPAA